MIKRIAFTVLLAGSCLFASNSQAVLLEQQVNNLTVKLSLAGDPVKSGTQNANLSITDASGKSITDAKVKVHYGMDAMADMPPMNYVAKAVNQGANYSASLNLVMGGRWNFNIKIKTSDGKNTKVNMVVNVTE